MNPTQEDLTFIDVNKLLYSEEYVKKIDEVLESVNRIIKEIDEMQEQLKQMENL